MSRKKKTDSSSEEEQKSEKKAPPIEMGEVSKENPTGIVSVSEDHAKHLGSLRGNGGPGAGGATVTGPVLFHATEGGTKPLPVDGETENEEGGASGADQPTSQQAALETSANAEEPTSEEEQKAE